MSAKERIGVVDVLRGVALLGIAVINVRGFVRPVEELVRGGIVAETPSDRLVLAAIDALALGKLYLLFSLLFGFGFAVQAEEVPTAPLVRRHVALIAIGLLHATLVWPGDILAVYGTLGLLLLPLRRTSTKRLVLLATLLLSLPVLCWGLIGGVALFLSERVPEAQRALAGDATLAAELSRLYGAGGDYPSFVRAQLATLTETYFTGVVTAPAVFAAFLFGVTLARARWLHVAPAHEKRWRRVRAACLFPALAANGALAAFHFSAPPEPAFDGWTIAHFVAVAIGGPSLCAIYVASAALTMGSGEPRSATTRLLAKAGRLSLSFYLMQSVIFAALFYPWGFGLASGVSVAEAEVIAVGVYALQLAIAAFWFDRFRRGPFEQIVRAVSRWRVSL